MQFARPSDIGQSFSARRAGSWLYLFLGKYEKGNASAVELTKSKAGEISYPANLIKVPRLILMTAYCIDPGAENKYEGCQGQDENGKQLAPVVDSASLYLAFDLNL